jgi:hypothetical protein
MATAAIGTAVSVGLSALSGALTPTKTIFNENNVGKIEDVSTRKTGAGWSLAKVYGRVQIKGCPIFWAPSRRQEVVSTTESQTSGGKGGGQTTVTQTNTYKYFGTFAFAVCEGQIDDIRQIKFNDTIWYNRDGELPSTVADNDYKLENYLTIHIGGFDQVIDPTIQSFEGNENGDRNMKGICYCVVDDFPLDEFNGELPSTIDVIVRREDNNKNRIDNVIYEVAERVGLVRDVDVKCSGLLNSVTNGAVNLKINAIFRQDGQTAAEFINEIVQRHFLFSYLDNTGAIVFQLPENTTATTNLNFNQLAAIDYGSEPGDPYEEIMPDISELPSSVTLNYTNLNDDFNGDNETRYYPLATHYNPKSINSILFLTPDDAKWWTWKYLQFAWLWARRFTVNLLPEDAINLTESFRVALPLIEGQGTVSFNIASILYGANLIGEIELYSFDTNAFTAQPTVSRVNSTVWNGGTIQLTPNINTDVSIVSANGAITYIEGVDYSVNATTGQITILPSGDIQNGDSITVYYGSNPDYTIVTNNPNNEQPDYGEPVITVVETNRIRTTDLPCIYAAIARDGDDFGATTVYARFNGGTYQAITTALLPTAKGTLSGSLPLASGLDTVNTATVIMNEGKLEALSQSQFDNQEIILLIGSEQIVARNVVLTAPNTYQISHLQRGVNGTPRTAHSNGEAVYIAKGTNNALISLPINQTLIGAQIDLKAVPNNVGLVDILTVTNHTIQGTYYKPYAPSGVTATKDGAGNITINWTANNTGLNALIPQSFEVDIYNGVTVARTLTSSESTVRYLASEQITDFNVTQSTITIRVYQLSSEVGRGYGYNISLTPTLYDPAPSVIDFSPRSGQVGDAITIYGSGFTSATAAAINGVSLTSFSAISDSVITGNINTGTTTGKVTVTNPTGTGESLTDFVIVDLNVEWGDIGGTLADQTDLQTVLDGKEPTIAPGTESKYWRGDKTWQDLNKTAVGLSNVDNTSDVNKPISTATQLALDGKFNNPTGTTSQYLRGDGTTETFPTVPTLTSQLTNDSGFITTVPANVFPFGGFIETIANKTYPLFKPDRSYKIINLRVKSLSGTCTWLFKLMALA